MSTILVVYNNYYHLMVLVKLYDFLKTDVHIISGGNAAASFNAWFPIVLGMFPGGGQGDEGGYSRGSQGGRFPPHHTTVIANSVSHGRSGVASSHAVAYGGGSSPTPQGSPQRR